MATFSSLPVETVEEIWENVLEPQDLSNLCRVSREVFHRGTRRVREHRGLMKKYGSVTIPGPYTIECLLLLLKTIIAQPHIGLYVRKLELHDWQKDIEPGQLSPSMTLEEHDLLQETLTKIIQPERLHAWMWKLQNCLQSAFMGLLFFHCSNLTILSIYMGYESRGVPNVENLLDSLKEDTMAQNAVLPNIENISFPVNWGWHNNWLWGNEQHTEQGNSQRYSIALDALIYAARIPSMRSITAFGEITSPQRTLESWFLSPYYSNVTNLCLGARRMDKGNLLSILAIFTSLKSFDYASSSSAENFNPTDIVAALKETTLGSLETFSIQVQDTDMGRLPLLPVFKEFKSLAVIGASVNLFGDIYTPHALRMRTIEATLPATMTTLKLYQMNSHSSWVYAIPQVIQACIAAKARFFPMLSHLKLYSQGFWIENELNHLHRLDSLVLECKVVGIALAFIEIPLKTLSSPYALPPDRD